MRCAAFWIAAGFVLAWASAYVAAWLLYGRQERRRYEKEADDVAQTAWDNA